MQQTLPKLPIAREVREGRAGSETSDKGVRIVGSNIATVGLQSHWPQGQLIAL
jgi:hypothetical protein